MFFSLFSSFYGQRSVKAAWATPGPWSIYSIYDRLFMFARIGRSVSTAHHMTLHMTCQMTNGSERKRFIIQQYKKLLEEQISDIQWPVEQIIVTQDKLWADQQISFGSDDRY